MRLKTVGEFATSDAVWSPDGASLAIIDRSNSQFCVLYDDVPESESGGQSISRRWDGQEGLTHVSEGDEEEDDRSVLFSLQEAEATWTRRHTASRPGLVVGA